MTKNCDDINRWYGNKYFKSEKKFILGKESKLQIAILYHVFQFSSFDWNTPTIFRSKLNAENHLLLFELKIITQQPPTMGCGISKRLEKGIKIIYHLGNHQCITSPTRRFQNGPPELFLQVHFVGCWFLGVFLKIFCCWLQ